MQKEIFEQPAMNGDTLNALINRATRTGAVWGVVGIEGGVVSGC